MDCHSEGIGRCRGESLLLRSAARLSGNPIAVLRFIHVGGGKEASVAQRRMVFSTPEWCVDAHSQQARWPQAAWPNLFPLWRSARGPDGKMYFVRDTATTFDGTNWVYIARDIARSRQPPTTNMVASRRSRGKKAKSSAG